MVFRLFFFAVVWLLCVSCGVYSFTGASVSPEAKTLSVAQFYNNALLGPSDMGNLLSEKLRQYFERNTSLSFVPEGGDILLSGQIDSYTINPVAPSASANQSQPDYAALTRLTLVVSVTYVNAYDETFSFEDKKFSFFIDFDQNHTDFSNEERNLVEEILDQIVLDIFNQSLANW